MARIANIEIPFEVLVSVDSEEGELHEEWTIAASVYEEETVFETATREGETLTWDAFVARFSVSDKQVELLDERAYEQACDNCDEPDYDDHDDYPAPEERWDLGSND